MDKVFKTFAYLVACTAVFLFLVRMYSNPTTSSQINIPSNQNTASLYFLDLNEVGNTTCEANGVAKRVVSGSGDKARQAVNFLIKGLTQEEVNNGLGSAINPKIALQKFEIKDKIAYIDFDSNLNPNINDSCGVTAVKSQIDKTLKSVSDISGVVISVNGQTEGILEP